MELQARTFLRQQWLKKAEQLNQMGAQLHCSAFYLHLFPDAGTLDLPFPPTFFEIMKCRAIFKDSYKKEGDLQAREKFKKIPKPKDHEIISEKLSKLLLKTDHSRTEHDIETSSIEDIFRALDDSAFKLNEICEGLDFSDKMSLSTLATCCEDAVSIYSFCSLIMGDELHGEIPVVESFDTIQHIEKSVDFLLHVSAQALGYWQAKIDGDRKALNKIRHTSLEKKRHMEMLMKRLKKSNHETYREAIKDQTLIREMAKKIDRGDRTVKNMIKELFERQDYLRWRDEKNRVLYELAADRENSQFLRKYCKLVSDPDFELKAVKAFFGNTTGFT